MMGRAARTSLAVCLLLAGCLDAREAGADGRLPPENEALADPGNGTADFDYGALAQFCLDNATNPCMFWDELYHEYVLYDLDTTHLEILVVPAPGADPLGDTEAVRQAVAAWRTGISQFAHPWFEGNYTVEVFVVGLDVPTVAAVEDPEIIVYTVAAVPGGGGGIGIEPKWFGCQMLGDNATRSYPPHRHGDVAVFAEDCLGRGFLCFAINAGALQDHRSVYDLVAHEVGHCLGAGHVGDADFRAKYAPVTDIMSYQTDPAQVHCVSNLNVRVLEGVYAHLLGRPEDEWLPAGSYYAMPPPEYRQAACPNPA